MTLLKGKFCVLRPITHTDLPTLLEWRNSEHVSKNMEYTQKITAEEHQNWFKKIHHSYHYFIIESLTNDLIGTIYLSNIKENNSAESGLYIGNKAFIGTGISWEASKLLIQYGFENLKLTSIYAKVKNDNYEIINYNKALGFKVEETPNQEFIKMFLQKKDR